MSSFEGAFYKIQSTSYFISLCFTLVFTSADIVFHNFLELHSTLSEKKVFSQIFLFKQIHLNLPTHSKDQNLLSATKIFC